MFVLYAPQPLERVLRSDTSALRFLAPALARHIREVDGAHYMAMDRGRCAQ